MFDFHRIQIDAVCPRCRFWNPASLRQVEFRDVLICRGCKANLQLDDYMNSARRARRDLEEALASLQKTFRGGKFTIKL